MRQKEWKNRYAWQEKPHNEANAQHRTEFFVIIKDIASNFHIQDEVIYLSINLCDNFLSRTQSVLDPPEVRDSFITCFDIAYRYIVPNEPESDADRILQCYLNNFDVSYIRKTCYNSVIQVLQYGCEI